MCSQKQLTVEVLGNIPSSLRDALLKAYGDIVTNFIQGRWEPSELNGGKLCEVTYSILTGYVDGTYPSVASKPSNMLNACRVLESAGKQVPRSLRIQIPRMLIALYEIRNNRGVGHVGGDVDPNHMDALAVLSMAKWIMAELVRIFHSVTTEEATVVVENLIERVSSAVWRHGDVLRVMDTSLGMKDKTLLLLYHCPFGASDSELIKWTEHSHSTRYRRDILQELHSERLIEYSEGVAVLTPKGIAHVEAHLPLEL